MLRKGVGSRATALVALLAVAAGGAHGASSSPAEPVATKTLLTKFEGPRTADIEEYARYDGQTLCTRGAKRGARALAEIIRERFPMHPYIGIHRPCNGKSVSEHYEGRALDWAINANRKADRLRAKRLIRTWFKKDRFGNRHAVARRLGIMYIIWNGRMWRAYRARDGWQPYEGSNPHTDHMHISLSRAGGRGLTSFWTGEIADVSGLKR